MQMTVEEIIRSYTEAKDKSKQIGILADLNGCDKEKIRSILRTKGVPLPTKGRPKGTSTVKASSTSTKKTTSTEGKQIIKTEYNYDADRKALILTNKTTGNTETIPLDELIDKTPIVGLHKPTAELIVKPTLPDIVKNMIKERLIAIESKILELRLDKEELEDFLEQFEHDEIPHSGDNNISYNNSVELDD